MKKFPEGKASRRCWYFIAFGNEQTRKRLLQATSVYSVWHFLSSFFFSLMNYVSQFSLSKRELTWKEIDKYTGNWI